MRTYGRTTDELGNKTWVEVVTDANGFNDDVYITALVQTLKLNLNESPFYASWGIPAKPSIVQQVYPDYYVALTQQRYAPRFANLIIASQSGITDAQGRPVPTYRVNVTTNYGAKIGYTLSTEVPT